MSLLAPRAFVAGKGGINFCRPGIDASFEGGDIGETSVGEKGSGIEASYSKVAVKKYRGFFGPAVKNFIQKLGGQDIGIGEFTDLDFPTFPNVQNLHSGILSRPFFCFKRGKAPHSIRSQAELDFHVDNLWGRKRVLLTEIKKGQRSIFWPHLDAITALQEFGSMGVLRQNLIQGRVLCD